MHIISPLKKIRIFLQLQKGMLYKYGWWRAWWNNKPVDAFGKPLPWLTYAAIDFLTQFDFQGSRVFEWGSGNSTLWWHSQGANVSTVESNKAFIPYIKTLLPADVNFFATEFDVAAELQVFQQSGGEFDIIVVDNHGPFRWQCCKVAPSKLRDGGVIILDNSEQCPKAWKTLVELGFTAIDFAGFCPANSYAQTTSIFFKSLGLKRRDVTQPVPSVAQPNRPWDGC